MAEIQSLARGLVILEELAEAPDGLGITELAAKHTMDKGNMSRLMQTLANYGFAEKDPQTRRYVLGPQIVRLSRAVLTRMPLRDAAKPFLDQLVAQTGECAHLAILAQHQALYIDQVDSPSVLRVTTGVGTLAPLYCTALGKILLAFGGAQKPAEMPAFTLRTITDPTLLEHHLDQVRTLGYAVDDEEYLAGVRCIAVPVIDYRSKCIAAIGISGPANRLTLEALPKTAQVVLDIGRSLSSRLSFKDET